MRIASNGNIGIGTNAPNELFHLHKNATSADVRMILTDNTSTASGSRGFHIIKGTANDAYLYNYENTSMVFGTNSAERLRIASNGNIGIGTATIQSSYKLQVQGNAWVENQLVFNNGFSGGSGGGGGAEYACNKIIFYGGANTPTTTAVHGFGAGVGFLDYYAGVDSGHRWYTGTTGGTGYGTERLRIASNGNIGIGTNNPSYKLHVNGTTLFTGDITMNEYLLFNDNTGKIRWLIWSANQNYYFGGDNNGTGYAFIWRNGAGTDGFLMLSNGNYSARGSYQAWSDIRIKKDIEDINDNTALQMILAIEPKTYKYIDGNKSKERVYGFIAQQVKEVIPEAVLFIETVIPNIYKNCLCEDNKRIYVEIPIDTLGRYIEISGYGKYKITKIEPDYIEVINDMHSKDIPDGENFVYGYEVKDFHTINKEYIFTLNVCATQELHRRIEAQSLLIKSHEDRIKDLETKMERMLSCTT